jgi:hypothetical protein
MKPRGKAVWELLGDFSASGEELTAIRSVLSRHENALDALKALPPGTLMYDLLDVCRTDGHKVRISFIEEH